MKKTNKKLLSGMVLPLIVAVVLVSAIILVSYGFVEQEIEVKSPIIVTSSPETMTAWLGQESEETGNPINIENVAPFDVEVEVSNDGESSGIEVVYNGELVLTKKDTTDWTATGTPITITYTIIGDSFEVSGVPEGYTLIYYKDNEANVDDAERLTVLGEVGSTSENLPHSNDWNAGDLADYCDLANGYDDYDSCRGAKLWAVPDANIVGGDLVWENPEEFYFETNLIQFNSDGIITIYEDSNIDLIPVYSITASSVGTNTVTTNVKNIE